MSWNIGPIRLSTPLVLAPMAGCTDLPFRLLCKEFGAGLCYAEMISAKSLLSQPEKAEALLQTNPDDQPVAMQLYGNDPTLFAEAAALLSGLPIAIIDINMGCPMEKVVREGAGAALMNNLPLAKKIIEAVCGSSAKPVTVKMRSGWNQTTITAPRLAQIAEDAGAKAIAVHARTWTDGFTGEIDWGIIEKIKKNVAIPVIGNGDLKNREEAMAVLARTGCEGMMLGRAALGAPWIFSARVNPHPSIGFRIKALQRHLALIEQYLSPEEALSKIRNHAWKYFRGAINGKSIRNRLEAARSYEALKGIVDSLAEQYG
ncbi:tRNA dihydrouridine synthase DusB [Thiovibrio sp. JS02]